MSLLIMNNIFFQDEFADRDVRLQFVNAIHDSLTHDLLDDVDGVILGGSGQFYLTEEHSWLDSAYGFVGHILERSIPVLGICFGFSASRASSGGSHCS